jgi:hypothetical protein
MTILCASSNPQSSRVLCSLPASHLGACVAVLGTREAVKFVAVCSGRTVAVKRIPVSIASRIMNYLAVGRFGGSEWK